MKINVTFQLLLYSCFMTIPSFGQTSKGSFLLGGSMGFTTNTNTSYGMLYGINGGPYETKFFSITAQPSVSYFIIDRLAVGLITPYSYSRTKSKNSLDIEMKSTTKTYSVGPTVRYYFPLGSQWAIFPEVSYSYGWTWNKVPDLTLGNPDPVWTYRKWTDKTRSFQGGVGLVYFLNQSVGVEGKAFYRTQHTTYDNRLDPNGTTSSDEPYFNFSLGVQIYFSRKANP
jgi:outer membrane protein W